MKTIVEIARLSSGAGDRGPWVRIGGRDHRGKAVTAVAFSARAEKLLSELGNLVPEGEDIASRRLIVEFSGEFRDGRQLVREGKPVTRGDGTPVLSRSFHIDTWNVLTGPTLELTRIRRDGEAVIAKAEGMRASGDISGAYLALAEFAAKACNRPLDLVMRNDLDDEEFGDPLPPAASQEVAAAEQVQATETASPAHDPEAAAAAAYAVEDFVSDPVAGAGRGPSVKSDAAGSEQEVSAPREDTNAGRDVLDDDAPGAAAPARRGLGRPVGVRPQAEQTSDRETVSSDNEAAAPRRRIGLGMRR